MDKTTIKPGAVVGRWTVLNDFSKNAKGEKKWLCRCECGTERYVLERALKSGGSLSCGCLRKQRIYEAVAHDVLGKTFGDLTVVGKSKRRTKHGTYWTCLCTCGYTCEATASELVSGSKTNCGCKRVKNYTSEDITGLRFGRLVALYRTEKRDKKGSVIWHCRCDCGNEVDVSYNAMVYANQVSCGCRRKEHDMELAALLTHVAGTSIDAIKSKKVPVDNTTGYKGVYLVRGKYMAKIVFRKKQYFLGTYDNIEAAAAARKEAEEVLFDGVAAHYRLWKERADADPAWGEQNPIQITVNQVNRKLSVTLLPELCEEKQEKEREKHAAS